MEQTKKLLEEAKKDGFSKSGSTGSTTELLREESHLYLGLGERHNLMICPQLTDFLVEKLTAQAAIDKARRKGREERRLAKNEKKPDEKEKKAN